MILHIDTPYYKFNKDSVINFKETVSEVLNESNSELFNKDNNLFDDKNNYFINLWFLIDYENEHEILDTGIFGNSLAFIDWVTPNGGSIKNLSDDQINDIQKELIESNEITNENLSLSANVTLPNSVKKYKGHFYSFWPLNIGSGFVWDLNKTPHGSYNWKFKDQLYLNNRKSINMAFVYKTEDFNEKISNILDETRVPNADYNFNDLEPLELAVLIHLIKMNITDINDDHIQEVAKEMYKEGTYVDIASALSSLLPKDSPDIEKNLYNRVISSVLEKYDIIELIELEMSIASVIDDPLELAFDFTELLVKYA